MASYQSLTDVRQAYFRAFAAEHASSWHLAVQSYLYCFEASLQAADERAARFFAAKLSLAYRRMEMAEKAEHYRRLC